MLSYLKDGQNRPVGDDAQNTPAQEGEGLCQPQDFLTVSGHSKKLRQSTLTLVVLFVVAALVVWFMVKKTTPAAATATNTEQTQLDAALAQLNSMQTEMNTQMDSVVGKFYQFNNVEQVEVNELKKNPFKRELADSAKVSDTRKLAANELSYLREKIQRQAAGWELWSITSTPKGVCCMINDKVLYEGDQLDGVTVRKIGEKTVTLECNQVSVELTISE